MQFGSVPNPELVDFTLPKDNSGTKVILKHGKGLQEAYVGCAKWGKKDLKKFYPRGTKDELVYYASQFNCIELNATFYNYSTEQIKKWQAKTPADFRFFPKVNQSISHFKRLKEVEPVVEDFTDSIKHFDDKFGMAFLQMRNDFGYKNMARLVDFIKVWPSELPLALELRNTEWFQDETVAKELYQLLEENRIANIITDTAGRRDLLHMRLTSTTAFVRYVGANHVTDYTRLDDWLDRIAEWIEQGLEKLYFFVHQNTELESPELSKYFIKRFNERFEFQIRGPFGDDLFE